MLADEDDEEESADGKCARESPDPSMTFDAVGPNTRVACQEPTPEDKGS